MWNFDKILIKHLEGFKLSYLKEVILLGSYKGREYSHILHKNDISYNFLPSIREEALKYLEYKGIKKHIYFDHLNSSQAACFNLFIPLQLDIALAKKVFKSILPDFVRLTGDIEFEYYHKEKDYLGEGRNKEGVVNVGTDSDVAIFYENTKGEKCLCLLEHKLSEQEFTNCNAYKSKNNLKKELCNNFENIWSNPDNCYYQSGKKYKYWELTHDKKSIFNHSILETHSGVCPFKGSMQQLWRNMLLARAIQNDPTNPIHKAYFGVVYHQENDKLFRTKKNFESENVADEFKHILSEKDKFFLITIQQILAEIKKNSPQTPVWIEEYEEKYINLK